MKRVVLKQLLLISLKSSSESECSVRKFVFSMINIQVRSTGMSNSFTRSILKFKRLTRD